MAATIIITDDIEVSIRLDYEDAYVIEVCTPPALPDCEDTLGKLSYWVGPTIWTYN